MSYPVTYYCPNCETLVELERDGYLSDKAVTPYPFEGWEYVAPDEPFEDRCRGVLSLARGNFRGQDATDGPVH